MSVVTRRGAVSEGIDGFNVTQLRSLFSLGFQSTAHSNKGRGSRLAKAHRETWLSSTNASEILPNDNCFLGLGLFGTPGIQRTVGDIFPLRDPSSEKELRK